ncbi:MAG TPA: DUF262 domain-containing protein [Pyrinomonadaceae bacterium]|jgi:hypothetical protein|nr:DUF262 domain-containing protein [Pyrinomonadaceae bacterium]
MDIQIIDLVRRFDSGEIRLPLMQRDYVWRPAKVVKLLDSIYRRWPIGCFYVWHTKHDQPAKNRRGDVRAPLRSMDSFYGFLLDGQQRLTSLSLAIQGRDEFNLSTRAFFDVENEQFFLGTMKKTIQRRIEADDPTLVPLSDLIPGPEVDETHLHQNIERIIDRLLERRKLARSSVKGVEYGRRLHRVASMLDVAALCEEFKDEHEENAIELFARLNKGGTSLSAGDVEAARLSQEATHHIVGPMRDFVQEPELRRLGLNFVFATRALVTIHRGSSSFANLPRNWAANARDVEDSWRRTAHGLRFACNLVREELGWTTRRWLPSVNALIPIAYLMKDQKGEVSRQEKEQLKRFLLLTGFRGLFRGSVETAINTFINPLREGSPRSKNRASQLVKKIARNRLYKIKPEDIKSASGMYSALMQVYLAYLIHRDARSWPSGRPIREIVSHDVTGDLLAVHHIFPKKFMQQFDIATEKLNTVANYALLSQADNAELSDRDPSIVHKGLSQGLREAASEQLFFRVSDEILSYQAYDEFIDFRARKIAEQLNDFLGLGK